MLTPNTFAQKQNPSKGSGTPYTSALGDVHVPFNVATTIFRYRAPEPVTLKKPCIYCGEIISPTGAPIKVEAWKNGIYGGDIDLHNGANQFDGALSLQGMELLELKIVAKTTQTDESATLVKDLWVMWSR